MSASYELSPPPGDGISHVQFSPSGLYLAVASWDHNIYFYRRNEESAAAQPYGLFAKIDTGSPALNVAWSSDDATLYCVGLSQRVYELRLVDNRPVEVTTLSMHTKPSHKVVFSRTHGLVLSSSWDGTVHVHDAHTKSHYRIGLPAKPYDLGLSDEKVVVAMGDRIVHVYDLAALAVLVRSSGERWEEGKEHKIHVVEPWQQRESSLKFMTRAVACMPDGAGFATSSIEGRVGVEWFDPDKQKSSYAFKCHRKTQKTADENGEMQEVDVIYPVNTIAWHPIHHTFATGGEDGTVAIWDAQTKRRVRQYKDFSPAVSWVDFSSDGKFMAVGTSQTYSDRQAQKNFDPSEVRVIVRALGETEVKGKVKADK